MTDVTEEAAAEQPAGRWDRPPLGPHTRFILFALACVALSAWSLIPEFVNPNGKGKDYRLWYQVGQLVLSGGDLYHGGKYGFGFLYPPFAAVLLAPFSLFGRAFSIFCLDLVNAASWWIAADLANGLTGVPGRKPWWLLSLPSVLALPFIYDMFDLGQPNLMLLAIMLAGLALLRGKREGSAGAMFALATALKAFPVAILPYLLWRRRWRAAGSMAVMTAVFLLLVPAPIRGFERNLAEVKTWANGMIFSASANGFGQRPEQNWGWKNDSLIALTHRYLRPINAEAENPAARPLYINVLDLSFDEANLVVVAMAGLIGFGFVAALPPERRRTPASDGAEYALLIALMVIASPLARAYYFVWLLFPFAVIVQHAALDASPRARRLSAGLLAAALAAFCLGIPIGERHWPQALGNMFLADAIVIGALVWLMRRGMAPAVHPSSKRALTDSPS